MAKSSKQIQPINTIQWIHRDELSANLYNPNKVAPPEMELIKQSIINDGWLFPILVFPKDFHIEGLTANSEKDKHIIIDGFHRFTVSGHKEIYSITDGYVPCVVITPTNPLATTVRMNRAKGTHAVLKMADIVLNQIKAKVPLEQIMQEFGMEKEEIVRLANILGVAQTDIVKNDNWSKSWKPK